MNHQVPRVTIEYVEKRLRTIKESKASGPDDIPNWFLKTFSHLLDRRTSISFNQFVLSKTNFTYYMEKSQRHSITQKSDH